MKLSEKIWHMWISLVSGRQWACGNKIKWRSYERSLEALEQIKKKGRHRNEMEPYPCIWCRKWHLGRLHGKHTWRFKYQVIRPLVKVFSWFEK